MTTDATLYLVNPGSQEYSSQAAGSLSIRGVQSSGQTVESQRCLDMQVESHPPSQLLTMKEGNRDVPVTFSWLRLEAHVWTRSTPRREIGSVHIDQQGMLPLGTSRNGPANWLWELLPEDVELAEGTHSHQANTPFFFTLEISGIARMCLATGKLVDLVSLRASNPQFSIELSQWKRLINELGYKLPPSHAALAGLAALQHPSWEDASLRLGTARTHLRAGEDYEALRDCLSTLESLVTPPYAANAWMKQLTALPGQKATGLAELFSGMAMYCNKIGHHRSRKERDAGNDLPQMPLDHWEADLAVGAAQFVTAYALRLRASGILVEAEPTVD
jgi:hypothetical protein